MSLIPGLSEEQAQRIISLFATEPKIREVLLFGSRAKGNFREGSDIDLAMKGEGLTLVERNQILTKYEDLFFPWKMDLLIYASIQEPQLKDHIDRIGRRILST